MVNLRGLYVRIFAIGLVAYTISQQQLWLPHIFDWTPSCSIYCEPIWQVDVWRGLTGLLSLPNYRVVRHDIHGHGSVHPPLSLAINCGGSIRRRVDGSVRVSLLAEYRLLENRVPRSILVLSKITNGIRGGDQPFFKHGAQSIKVATSFWPTGCSASYLIISPVKMQHGWNSTCYIKL
jgi:hypothetical protein